MNKKNELSIIGWRECVSLPDLKVFNIKVKVDTGARTSSIHAHDLEIVNKEGIDFASFYICPLQDSSDGKIKCFEQVQEFRKVKSSNGATELRPVILSRVILGDSEFDIELTLTNRDEMGFRMLLGRSSIKNKFLVNPGKSFISKEGAK